MDYLAEAEARAHNAIYDEERLSQFNTLLAIAYALIALVERMDKAAEDAEAEAARAELARARVEQYMAERRG